MTEFGRYAPPANASKLYRLATFFQLAFQGSYVERFPHRSHVRRHRNTVCGRQLPGGATGVSDKVAQRQGGVGYFADDERLLKPNRVAFVGDRIVVTDKDARCILWLAWDGQQLRQVDLWTGPDRDVEFGRLGNVLGYKDESLFVCDERAHVIWYIDLAQHGFSSAVKGEDSGTGVFLPFSCAAIDDHLRSRCGGLNFQIIDLRTQTVVYCSPSIGELHSIAYEPSTKRLMICNRSEHRIDIYRVTLA